MISRRQAASGSGPRSRRAPALAVLTIAAIPAVAPAQVSLSTVVELAQKNSATVRMAQADVQKAQAQWGQARDAFVPSISFGSGLPAFREVGFTGSLPTIWDSQVQSMVFSMPQIRYIQAARMGVQAAQSSLKDAEEQVALDASMAYIELDTVDRELMAAHEQEEDAARSVAIERQRAEAGVDPLSTLLQAQLTAAQIKLKRLHLETRYAKLAEQVATLTGLPVSSITPQHSSIPEIPAISADESPRTIPAIESALAMAHSKEFVARGDNEHQWFMPEIGFGLIYNRNTRLLNNIGSYFVTPPPDHVLPANNFSSGFSIRVPLFNLELHNKAKESAADALRARVEAEQAEHQNDIQIAELTASLRELDARAEVANLKRQIAEKQLKGVEAQLQLGNGAGNSPGAPQQLTPTAEQQAHINERQGYQDALEAFFDLSKARLGLLRALGHMQDWLVPLRSVQQLGDAAGAKSELATTEAIAPEFNPAQDSKH